MSKWILLIGCFTSFLVYSQTKTAKIKAINFAQEGEISKLVIDLDQPAFAERTHLKEDKQIILDLKGVEAPEKILRGIDTSEFSGSSVYVSPYKKPGEKDSVRFAIQLRDNVRSLLEQNENRITLKIENRFGAFARMGQKVPGDMIADNEDEQEKDSQRKLLIPKSDSVEDILENLTLSGSKKYIGKKITINVNNVGYRELLKMIADTSGFNIIIDEEVNAVPPLTISLTNIPWDQALDTILSLGELVALKHSNILTVKTATRARAERRAQLELEQANQRQEPLVTKVFPVSFAAPDELIEILRDYLTPERGAIRVDNRTSNIIVKDTLSVIERMGKIVDTLDTETPQVLIEAKIVEANENYEFRAGLGRGGIGFGYDMFGDGNQPSSGSFAFNSTTDSQLPNALSATISVYKRLTNLSFSLELMESESKGKVISSPKIITQNNQAATITSTDTQNYRTQVVNQGVITESFQDVSVSINLTVTPKVTNDGSISMNVNLNKGGFLPPAVQDGLPSTSNKVITTNVLVDNGSTVVIGGLYQTTNNEIESGIPFLKDIPLIGWLFRSAYNPRRNRSELIVFLTPRIVNQEEAGLIQAEQNSLVGM